VLSFIPVSQVGEDGKPVVYKKAKLGNSNKMYYNEEVRVCGWVSSTLCCCTNKTHNKKPTPKPQPTELLIVLHAYSGA
jgi:hypothetical protein